MNCQHCGGELTQKSTASLFVASVIMFGCAVASFFIWPIFWIVGMLFLATAAYLWVWATRGKGLWCRSCKKFPAR
ncbi:MAG TPA: hypothetical protein VJR26_00705 [Candidatus Acidoferrales bacterium]|nr:hypothetical protein [Candidatus Acidoferrales bacterium]